MNELNVLFELAVNTEYGQYVMIIASICYSLSHIIANLPQKIVEKIPNSLMIVVNFLSANYKNSANKKLGKEGEKNNDEGS